MKRPTAVALLLAISGLGLAVILSRPESGVTQGGGPQLRSEPLAWSRIDLPAGLQVDALAAEPGHAVVAGRVGDGDSARSVVLEVASDDHISAVRVVSTVRVEAHTTYGRGTRWASLALSGGALRAIGSRAGGAHLIPRWTVWSGRLDAPAQLEEQVQTFETFGGPAAGGLVEVVAGGSHAAILGSWESRSSGGLDIALWTPSGSSWQRVADPDPLFRSSTTREVQASALALTPRGLVVVGTTLDLAGGEVTERAVAWSGEDARGPWRMVRLPASSTSSSAQAVACDGRECWVQGRDGEVAALWWMDAAGAVPAAVDAAPAASLTLPVRPSASTRARPMALADGRLWLAIGGADGLLVHQADGWRTAAAPPGTVTALAAADGTLWAATTMDGRAQVWVASTG